MFVLARDQCGNMAMIQFYYYYYYFVYVGVITVNVAILSHFVECDMEIV
jgi:hypothetical protein